MKLPLVRVVGGKVRDLYSWSPQQLLVVTSDRVSAFDAVLGVIVPRKGVLLNAISNFWFTELKDVVDNHLLDARPNLDFVAEEQRDALEGRVALIERAHPLPFEFIVRGWLAGSAWKSYQNDCSINGIKFAAGMYKGKQFPRPILTPTHKVATGHDIPCSMDEISQEIGSELAQQITEICLDIFSFAADRLWQNGLALIDTKVEFGINEDGKLLLIDEVLTPDSSRIVKKSTLRDGADLYHYDKQYLRDYLAHNCQNPAVSAAAIVPPEPILGELYRRYLHVHNMLLHVSE